jgi:hypothetical protein
MEMNTSVNQSKIMNYNKMDDDEADDGCDGAAVGE